MKMENGNMKMEKRNRSRKAVIASVAFLVYTAGAMAYSSQHPGQTTRAQAAEANQAVTTQCANAKTAGMNLVDRTAACLPAPLRQVENWLMLGMVLLGAVMLGTGFRASRDEK